MRVFLLLAALLAMALPVSAADSNTIRKFCLAAFRSAMAQAGKRPPDGMGADTCNCFLREVGLGKGIDSAQEICKEEAARKYKL